MTTVLRRVSVPLLLIVATLGVTAQRPQHARGSYTVWLSEADSQQSQELDARAAAGISRTNEKAHIVECVRTGQVSSASATARFQELIVADLDTLAMYREVHPGLTDAELAAENFARHMSASAE